MKRNSAAHEECSAACRRDLNLSGFTGTSPTESSVQEKVLETEINIYQATGADHDLICQTFMACAANGAGTLAGIDHSTAPAWRQSYTGALCLFRFSQMHQNSWDTSTPTGERCKRSYSTCPRNFPCRTKSGSYRLSCTGTSMDVRSQTDTRDSGDTACAGVASCFQH